MTDAKTPATVSEAMPRRWNDIDWNANRLIVRNLRQRIYRTSREGNRRKLRSLQRLMLKCTANRETSIRQVTQINTGRNTPGVDKITVKTPEARTALMQEISTYEPWKAQPVKRVYIPKAKGKRRPLGIPTIRDRVMQAIAKNALEPEWEAKFEPCSYGFRPGRSCHDATSRIYGLARPNKHKKWIVDADITGAFDNIRHETILEAIRGFPGSRLIKAWLKAGVLDGSVKMHTAVGTPQGGVISPLLANIALHGMESALGVKYRKKLDSTSIISERAVIRYADDFVIFTENEADAYQARAEEKTRICHITEGFDFLGFTVRQYPNPSTRTGWKLLITPSKESVKTYKHRMKQEWKTLVGHNAERVTGRLNPIIRGWGNYFRCHVASDTFHGIDDWMYKRAQRWCRRTHPNKGGRWITDTYFGKKNPGRQDRWVFGGERGYLEKLGWIPIRRHAMVKANASPDNPELRIYWEERNRKKADTLPFDRQRWLARRQKGICPVCRMSLHNGEELHVHHVTPKSKGGSDKRENLQLTHLYCHQQIHRREG